MGCLKLKGQAKSADLATLLREMRESKRMTHRLKGMLRNLEEAVAGLHRELRSNPPPALPAGRSLPLVTGADLERETAARQHTRAHFDPSCSSLHDGLTR